ncbi:amidohydrolase family protein [Candidatus Poriferisocius sp.]|uniref:amidohydrolase family protein n=1 Tax=Candidatus Poriferisocius sp. TaxID=3101276 RepID=UPI003B024284
MKSKAEQRVLLVSGDSHAGPTLEALRSYCPGAYLGAFDEFSTSAQVEEMRAGVRESGSLYLNTSGHDDPGARLADMNRDGIAAEVIFHNSFNGEPMPFLDLGWPEFDNPELAGVGFQIYNRWLADFCAAAPERLIGLAHIPLWDIDAAIKELHWAADHGLRAINFPSARPQWIQYNNPHWDPFWAAVEETGLVLATHAGAATDPAVQEVAGTPLLLIEAGGAYNRRAVARMILGGVFERFPGLRLAMTEQPGVWIPAALVELDTAALAPLPLANSELSKAPSEYFKSNVFVGASFIAPFEVEAAVDDWWWTNIFWGRDYPHPEGTWRYSADPEETPMTHLSLRHAMAGIPEDKVRAIVGENAARVYGLDVVSLQSIADEIGPTIEDITAPLDDVPALDGPERKGYGYFAFRTVGPYA